LSDPTELGKVVWADMKSNPTIDLLPTWKEILAAKIEAAH